MAEYLLPRASKAMADRKKKKSSGKKSEAPAKPQLTDEVAAVESGQLHSPWLPLVWILVPLFACIVYGVLTRSHGH